MEQQDYVTAGPVQEARPVSEGGIDAIVLGTEMGALQALVADGEGNYVRADEAMGKELAPLYKQFQEAEGALGEQANELYRQFEEALKSLGEKRGELYKGFEEAVNGIQERYATLNDAVSATAGELRPDERAVAYHLARQNPTA